jgi:hypothetical protein
MNLDGYLKVVGDYADQIAQADATANRDTMSVAEAMDAMYESREWVAEWLEQKPRPKSGGSNRWQADSRNRFAQWIAWKLEQSGRRPVLGRHTYQLLDGVRVAKAIPNLRAAQVRTEFTVRPLKWLLTNRYEERIPEVWAIAVDLAGGDPASVTAKHTREALKQWKAKTFTRADGTPKSNRAVTAAAKANSLRRRVLDEFAEMYRLACENEKAKDEFNGLLTDLDAFLDAHAADDAA